MGITPMDLLNDILTTDDDLRYFLNANNVEPAFAQAGLIIQSYLTFCRLANQNVWDPCEKNNTEIIQPKIEIDDDQILPEFIENDDLVDNTANDETIEINTID